jgi:hypothetical protein
MSFRTLSTPPQYRDVAPDLKNAPGPQAAPDLSAVVGGTPLQVRTALARLIERGVVSWTGQARGTRYTAV